MQTAMEDIKSTMMWGTGLLITGAVAGKVLNMIPQPRKMARRSYPKRRKKKK